MAFLKFGNNVLLLLIFSLITQCRSNDILGCGGFVKSHVALDFSKIEIGLYTRDGSLKEKTECAPTNGYYFLPLYEKGDYVLKVQPPAGWSFEPSQVEILVDGETDQCSMSQDINFSFNGFGITGKIITAGQKQGPSGVNVQLVNDKGDVRNAVTSVGGEFHFTPVIPGKYVVKASHSKWKLEPSQAIVQVKEGNTVLPVGSLAVKGYDVTGTVSSFGSPISGIHILLYSKEENPKFRVEGCKTALLQGVPDAPICYSVTDGSGEFTFGLVPTGDYKLLAMTKAPGQTTVSYNIKPDEVPFNVQHDSLFIKNAFEVTGFNIVGSVLSSPGGSGIQGVRVLMGGQPVATTDNAGKFPLSGLKPGTYGLTFQHEQCMVDELPLKVSAQGAGPAVAVAARWRVCGQLTPAARRTVAVHAAASRPALATVPTDDDGTWCTFLPPGVYSVKVEVSEQEQRDGLQFYPEWRQVSVARAALGGVAFSQVRASVRGRVLCGEHCAGVAVQLRPLAADGTYTGPPRTAEINDEWYEFEDVSAGSVEVSVVSARVCWRERRHNVAVTHEPAAPPPFEPRGLVLRVRLSHAAPVLVAPPPGAGPAPGPPPAPLDLPAGLSARCLPPARSHTLTPAGCHKWRPLSVTLDMTQSGDEAPLASFVAEAHAAVVVISAPVVAATERLQLRVTADGTTHSVELRAARDTNGEYVYEHTLYLAEGEVVEVEPSSSELVFPGGPHVVRGAGDCQPAALRLRAARAVHVRGRTVPPVAGVSVALTGENVKLVVVTGEDGSYSFGPLAAGGRYAVEAHKDSYAFGPRQDNGDIAAQRLAEITVDLLDDADGRPLEGALVSASGGAFRRNVAAGAGGRVRLAALPPAQYYVKPNMKEYRFTPAHAIRDLPAGEHVRLSFRGTRVAWSALGEVVSLGGVGVAGAGLRAVPRDDRCAAQDATADEHGRFRIRGLQPNCVYALQLKESPDMPAAELARAPPPLEVKGADITGLRLIMHQPQRVTDGSVLVTGAAGAGAGRALRLSLAPEGGAALLTARPAPGELLQLPRLPADRRSYVLTLDAPPRAPHVEDVVLHFVSDGQYKHFHMHFEPKVKSPSQEVRAGSVALMLAMCALVAAVWQRRRLLALLPHLPALPALPSLTAQPAQRADKQRTTQRKKQN